MKIGVQLPAVISCVLWTHSWKSQGRFSWESMEGLVCCPAGPSVADLQPWVSCWCKIQRICPFSPPSGGWGLAASLPELECSTARAVACGGVCSDRSKAPGSREIQAFSSGAWCSHQGDTRCRQWVLDLATLELLKRRWERAWLPRTPGLCLCLSNEWTFAMRVSSDNASYLF